MIFQGCPWRDDEHPGFFLMEISWKTGKPSFSGNLQLFDLLMALMGCYKKSVSQGFIMQLFDLRLYHFSNPVFFKVLYRIMDSIMKSHEISVFFRCSKVISSINYLPQLPSTLPLRLVSGFPMQAPKNGARGMADLVRSVLELINVRISPTIHSPRLQLSS